MKNIRKVCMITCMASMISFFLQFLWQLCNGCTRGQTEVGQVTEYIDEDGAKKTIYWADHITPPRRWAAATVNFKNMNMSRAVLDM